MSAVVPDVSNDKVVRLETTLGEVEYVVSFEDSSAAAAFKKAVTEQAAKGEAEEVRKVRISVSSRSLSQTISPHKIENMIPCHTQM